MKKSLPVPWFPQRDNVYNPGGTCNVTSLAMGLSFLGIKGDGNGQLEDQLFLHAKRKQLDYHEAETIRYLANWKLRKDPFDPFSTWTEIRAHVLGGNPVVVHTFLTPSGHIPIIVGFDDEAYGGKGAWIVNDPAGEWHDGGYGSRPNGDHVLYSYFLMDCVCRATDAGGYAEAMAAYHAGRHLPASQKTLWAHPLSR